MAIQKEKTLNSGVTGNYWRILSISIDRQNLSAHSRIGLFKDKATSDAGGQPIGAIKEFRFDFTMSEFLSSSNAVAFAYGKIRAAAETMVTHDIMGNPLETPFPYDVDIAGGTTVL